MSMHTLILRLTAVIVLLASAPATAAAQGFNLDIGTMYGTPSSSYGAASGQAGTWNQVGLGVTPLVDLSGAASGVSVTVTGEGDSSFLSTPPANDDELLLNDNLIAFLNDLWTVDFAGLTPGEYGVIVYAPSHASVWSGALSAGGTPLASLTGDPASNLVEYTSWAQAHVTVTGSTLAVSGAGTGFIGVAGIQLVPYKPAGVNLDFGTAFGAPSASYGGVANQPGVWHSVGLGTTSVIPVEAGGFSASVVVNAGSATGSAGGSRANDPELLLEDNLLSLNGTWTIDIIGLPERSYFLYLYAPTQVGVTTGSMYVEGLFVGDLTGSSTSTLIEGVSWMKLQVPATDGTYTITSPFSQGVAGLAGLQLVPAPPEGLNIDFGTAKGAPLASYGAASAQVGAWNIAGLGTTSLKDAAGAFTGPSVTVSATSETGLSILSPITDDELLMCDNFYSSSGSSWTIDFVDLTAGDYRAYIYAPANSAAPTGNMLVDGILVASIPGSPVHTLIEGTSWLAVDVTAPDGTLQITGAGASFSGLAGIQLVMQPKFETYCTAGASASGCTASISATGTASATATSGFTLDTSTVEGAKNGLYFFGTNGRQANTWGNGTSYQCVVPPVKRAGLLPGSGSIGACDGFFSQDLNAMWTASPAKNPGAGSVVQAQLWYRDAFNTSNQKTSLSDAIEFTVNP